MRKITKLMLALALCVVSVGASAVKLDATFGTPAGNGSWDANTNTYTWTGSTNNLMTIFSFSNGDLAKYSKIHLEVAQDPHHNFRFCLMNGSTPLGTVTCWSSGIKDITFSEHENTRNVDLSQVTHIAFGGSEDPGENNSYSCVLTNVYLEGPATGYDVAYKAGTPLSLESIVSGNTLVSIAATNERILYGTHKDNQIYLDGINSAMRTVNSAGSNSSTYQFRIVKATDEGQTLPEGVTTLYRIQAFKGDGTTIYTGPWSSGNCYLNDIGWTRNIIPQGDAEGEQGCFFSITAVSGKENTYKITSYLKNGTVKSNDIYGNSEWVFYVLGEKIVPAAGTYDATDAKTDCFANFITIDGGATIDADTRTFTKTCGWQWTGDGLDLSQYRYLVITAAQNRDNGDGGLVSIKDKYGISVNGDQYGDPNANMRFSHWDHNNCCSIDLDKIRLDKGFDIHHITELTIDGGSSFVLGNVYATNLEPVTKKPWEQGNEGSYRRTGLGENVYGTICLPYQAAIAGAYVYEISGGGSSYVELSQVNGLLEAGKPYFYYTIPNKNNGDGRWIVGNCVYFYQATSATVEDPVENNGLIGTFTSTTAPQGVNYYVLSSNELYQVDSEVTVGANKAYIDASKVINKLEAKSRAFINFEGQATGIAAIENNDAVNVITNAAIYNLNGQRVMNPTRGIYIVNGKKLFIK